MVILTPDSRYRFEGREGTSDEEVVRETWVENVYQVFEGDFQDQGTCIDLGANIGAFSVYARKMGAKRIIAVEPQEDNLELLSKNDAINGTLLSILDKAVTYEGYKFMKISNGCGNSKIVSSNEEGSACIGITLEEILKESNIKSVDVLKCDIEGFEYAVFEDASEYVMKRLRYITMEFHNTESSTFGALVAKLSLTHNVHIIGSYLTGGNIYAKLY